MMIALMIYVLGLLAGVFAQDGFSNISVTTDNVNTTTEVVNTTTEIVTTTTEVVTTLTPAVSSSTPATTPMPPPHVDNPVEGSWSVTNSNNITCIKLDAAIQFQFVYKQGDQNVKTKLNVPKNATVDDDKSSCESHVISLKFDLNSFTLTFVQEDKKVFAKKAKLRYFVSNETFPGAKNIGNNITLFADNLTLFEVPLGKSYLCKKAESEIKFSNITTATLTSIQAEAFKNNTNSDFSTAVECSSDEKINDIVPIAVGCALAALVIIVLIAYLVGRQRTRQRGYQSV